MPAQKSSKIDYARIEREWTAMRGWKAAQAANPKLQMSAWLAENGHIAQKEKGAARGQDYIRFIQMNSKLQDALLIGEAPQPFLERMIKEAQLKREAQEKTGKAKILLEKKAPVGAAGSREARAVREPQERSGGGGGRRERKQPSAAQLRALLEACEADFSEERKEELADCLALLKGMAERKDAYAAGRSGSQSSASSQSGGGGGGGSLALEDGSVEEEEVEFEDVEEASQEQEEMPADAPEEEEEAPPPPPPPPAPKKSFAATIQERREAARAKKAAEAAAAAAAEELDE
jgi:hypothetical protein